jgi:predicted alpha/beta superfamily hydrolase
VCPRMVIVGIPNTVRSRDLTPTQVKSTGADSSFHRPTGGGEAFTEFLAKEVIPYIEKNYPVSQERILVGHSLGGLMVINTLIKHPALFDKYVAIDPSLWWDNHKPLSEYQRALAASDLSKKALFIAVANTVEMDTANAMLDTLERTDHFRSIIQFTKTLRTTKSGLDWKYKYYDDEGHSSVPMLAEYDALHFLYRKIFITLDQATLKTFEGTYKHQFTEGVDSFIDITATEDGLVLHEQWSDRKIGFKPLSQMDFYATESQFPLRFIRNNDGEIREVLAFNHDVWTRVAAEKK